MHRVRSSFLTCHTTRENSSFLSKICSKSPSHDSSRLQVLTRGSSFFNTSGLCSVGINRFWLVGCLRVLLEKNLVDQLFQSAANRFETVERAFARLCRVIVARAWTFPMGYRVSTENGLKSVPLRNVNRINPNRPWLKRLIPIEHDLGVQCSNPPDPAVQTGFVSVELYRRSRSLIHSRTSANTTP